MSGPSSAQLRLQIIEALTTDHRLNALAARVGAAMLTRYWDRAHFARTGELVCYPGLPRLAADVGSSQDSVSSALRRLTNSGHLELLVLGIGRGRNSRFRFVPSVAPPVQKTPDKARVFLGHSVKPEEVALEVENPEFDAAKTPNS